MAGFAPADSFLPVASAIQLLPIRFERLGEDRFLVGNLVGDMTEMTQAELDRLCALDLAPGDGLYERAFEKLFIGCGMRATYEPGVHFQTISATFTGFGIRPSRAKRSATACWDWITSSSTGTTR